MIIFDDVYFQYEPEGTEALRGVTLSIKDGEHVALIGPNGCGKTTLIRHLNALLLPVKGKVTLDGLDTRDVRHHRDIRRLAGMVFQNPDHQIVGMTVEEDCAFGPENLRLPSDQIRRRVADALERVGMADQAGRPVENLSGGEKRLAAIAGILAMAPRYIALDEPTAFLDPVSAKRVLEMIAHLHAEGMGIVHITHNMAEAARAQRIVVMSEGCVYLDGTPQEIFGSVEAIQAIGMTLPQITQLLMRLRDAGIPVRTDILDIEEALEQVKTFMR